MIRAFISIFIVLTFFFSFSSCNEFPDGGTSDLKIELSIDSISFDTIVSVFETTTQSFRIINRNFQPVNIKDIRLASGEESFFRLNVDGVSCQSFQNYELRANDSIFVFVEAKFPRFDVDTACFILDSVLISTQSSTQSVTLLSWSQDVNLKSGIINSNEVWDSSRPYLVIDSLEIPYDETLLIKKGVRVLFHKDAFLKVMGGLKVEGTIDQPVFFQGDRFDVSQDGKEYEHEPGQWTGLQFYPFSQESDINYAVIKNGLYGILILGSLDYPELPKLNITNTIIKNQSYAGIVSYGAKMDCSNTFFNNCYSCILLYTQGEYNFNHVTVSNEYKYKVREAGSIHVCNYIDYNGTRYVGEFEAVNFSNSIIYGSIDNEFTVAFLGGSSVPINLDHCLLKLKNKELLFPFISYNQLLLNDNPLLTSRESWNSMYPDTLSPFIDKGSIEVANNFSVDFLGNSRLIDGKPDMGAIEFMK